MSVLNIMLAKIKRVVQIDTAVVPANTNAFMLRYGYTQWINDGVAGVARKNYRSDEEFEAAAQKAYDARLERIRTGDMPGARVAVNPIKVLAASLGVPEETLQAALDKVKADEAAAKAEAA